MVMTDSNVSATQNSPNWRTYHLPTHLPRGAQADALKDEIKAIDGVQECTLAVQDVHVVLSEGRAWNIYCDRKSGNIVVDDDEIHRAVARCISGFYRGRFSLENIVVYDYSKTYPDRPGRVDAAA